MSELLKKIANIARTAPSLKKEDRNNFAKYNFVSIDAYYEEIARHAIDGGVFWTTTEVGFVEREDFLQFEYEFTVYDLDGKSDPLSIKLTVPHPRQGAQTAGASMSYAEKVFMRSLFKCITGEPDSDSFDNTRPPPRRDAPAKKLPAKGQPEIKPEDISLQQIISAFRAAPDKDNLVRTFVNLKAAVNHLSAEDKAEAKKVYNEIQAKFTSEKTDGE